MIEIKNLFDWIGYVSTALTLAGIFVAIWLWFKGILPVLLRLGNGLSKRKIGLFSTSNSLVSYLIDSELFSEKNIIHIESASDIGRAEKATIFIVVWEDFQDSVEGILAKKRDATALLVYAEPGKIVPDDMKKLNAHRNVVVSNFRGRLINDIVSSMITTSYERSK